MNIIRLLSRGGGRCGLATPSTHGVGTCNVRMFSSEVIGTDWLNAFTNFEQQGVPKNAGVDCDEGFSLVCVL